MVPYYLMVGLFDHWTGDFAAPSRQLVAIVPLFVLPIAGFLERLRPWLRYSLFTGLAVPSLLLAVYGVTHPQSLFFEGGIRLETIISSLFPPTGPVGALLIFWLLLIGFLVVIPWLPMVNFLWKDGSHVPAARRHSNL